MSFYNTWASDEVIPPYNCSDQPYGRLHPHQNNPLLVKYCQQSRFYSCAAKIHCPIPELSSRCAPADQQKLANFFACSEFPLNSSGDGPKFSKAAVCAKRFGLDLAPIEACAPGDEPLKVIDLINHTTAAAKPPVKAFPEVRVEGVSVDFAGVKSDWSGAAKDLIAAICKAYKGSSKPAACK